MRGERRGEHRVWKAKQPDLEEGEIGPDDDRQKKEKTFFLSNLPGWLKTEELRAECVRFGQLGDIYIARKKDKYGGSFAFARYGNIRHVDKMVKALNTLSFGGVRIWAKVARFGKEGNEGKNPRIPRKPSGGSTSGYQGRTFVGNHSNQSFKEILAGKKGDSHDDISQVLLDETGPAKAMEWAGRSVVGYAHNIAKLCKVDIDLGKVNLGRMEIRYLGGMKVLITFSAREVAKTFIDEKKQLWEVCFSEAILWEGEWLDYERIAWLKFDGIPAALWDIRNVSKIGERFGKVVEGVNNMIGEGNLAYAHMGVLLQSGKRINEEIVVSWGGQNFKCWVSEDAGNWVPGFVSDDLTVIGDDRVPEDDAGVQDGLPESNAGVHDGLPESNAGISQADTPAAAVGVGGKSLEDEEAGGCMGGGEESHSVHGNSGEEALGNVPAQNFNVSNPTQRAGVGHDDILSGGPAHEKFVNEVDWAKAFTNSGLMVKKKRKRPVKGNYRTGLRFAPRRTNHRFPDLNSNPPGESSPSSGSVAVKKKQRIRRKSKVVIGNLQEGDVPDTYGDYSGGIDDEFESDWGESGDGEDASRPVEVVSDRAGGLDKEGLGVEADETRGVGEVVGLDLKGFEASVNEAIIAELGAVGNQ